MLAGSNKRKRKQGIFSADQLLKKQEQVDHERMQADDEEDEDTELSADDSGSDGSSDCGTDEDQVHTFSSITPVERISLEKRPGEGNTDKKVIGAHTQAPLSFSELGISTPLQAALASMSIRKPTEVQTTCIPVLLAGECTIYLCIELLLTLVHKGRDCIGNAKTGSGKTIAFALPILQKLAIDPYGIYALVLTPTRCILCHSRPTRAINCICRELAFQIADQFAVLGASVSARTAVVVGGMDMMAQALELDGLPHIVIATPGRIVDHLRSSSGVWNLSRVKFLVSLAFSLSGLQG